MLITFAFLITLTVNKFERKKMILVKIMLPSYANGLKGWAEQVVVIYFSALHFQAYILICSFLISVAYI